MNNNTNEKWYRPKQIAQLGLIQSSAGTNNPTGNYAYILRMIRRGQLKAKDYSALGARPFWKVSQSEIDRFNATYYEITKE